MTVCFRCTLVPRDRSLRPAGDRIEALVERLTAEGYLEASPARAARAHAVGERGLAAPFDVLLQFY